MIKLKEKVNASAIIREMQRKADKTYEMAWESEYAKVQYMEGVRDTLNRLKK